LTSMSARLSPPMKEISEIDGSADARSSRIFIHCALISCILMQRFGLVFGQSIVFFSLPAFAGLLAWMIFTGRATIRSRVALYYLICGSCFLLSALVALVYPDNRTGLSLLSLTAIAINYTLFLIGPNRRFDGREVFKIFIFYCRICAVFGILQYLIQFGGIRIFSFTKTLPFLSPFLVETRFAFNPILHYGSSLLRSNGMFLLEAATFSKLLVWAIAVEFFILKQWKFLPVYAIAYLFSYSGTGLLCLLLTLPIYALFDKRAARPIILFGVAMMILVGVIAVALPQQFASLAGRATEVQSEGSSGYARYIAQFGAIGAVASETRSIIGFGPGATDRASFYTPGSGNAAMKLYIDYGVIGLIAFSAFLVAAVKGHGRALLAILSLVTYQFGGGNLLFSPLIVLMALLCVWSTMPDEPRSKDVQ